MKGFNKFSAVDMLNYYMNYLSERIDSNLKRTQNDRQQGILRNQILQPKHY